MPAWTRTATRWDWLIVVATAVLAAETIWVTSEPVLDSYAGLLDLLWPVVGVAWAVRLFETVRQRRSRALAVVLGLGAAATTLGFLPFMVWAFLGIDPLVVGLPIGIALFAIVVAVEHPRRMVWAIAPAIAVITAIAVWSEIPAAVRFAFGERELTAYAEQIVGTFEGPEPAMPTPDEPIRVGSITVYAAEWDGTCVRLTTAQVGILGDDDAGIAWCPNGPPSGPLKYRQLAGEWYRWLPY
jgi:hypothetical protein